VKLIDRPVATAPEAGDVVSEMHHAPGLAAVSSPNSGPRPLTKTSASLGST
jgi:hypothetical protein